MSIPHLRDEKGTREHKVAQEPVVVKVWAGWRMWKNTLPGLYEIRCPAYSPALVTTPYSDRG